MSRRLRSIRRPMNLPSRAGRPSSRILRRTGSWERFRSRQTPCCNPLEVKCCARDHNKEAANRRANACFSLSTPNACGWHWCVVHRTLNLVCRRGGLSQWRRCVAGVRYAGTVCAVNRIRCGGERTPPCCESPTALAPLTQQSSRSGRKRSAEIRIPGPALPGVTDEPWEALQVRLEREPELACKISYKQTAAAIGTRPPAVDTGVFPPLELTTFSHSNNSNVE
jgi:hypothetical protein